jgi:hypothetical protein
VALSELCERISHDARRYARVEDTKLGCIHKNVVQTLIIQKFFITLENQAECLQHGEPAIDGNKGMYHVLVGADAEGFQSMAVGDDNVNDRMAFTINITLVFLFKSHV